MTIHLDTSLPQALIATAVEPAATGLDREALIAFAGVLLGAVISAATTLLAVFFGHRYEHRRERRERHRKVAERCRQLLGEFERAVRRWADMRRRGDDTQFDEEPLWDKANQLHAAAVDLPFPIRERVTLATNALLAAGDLATGRPLGTTFYLSEYQIAYQLTASLQEDLAAFIEGGKLPPPAGIMVELQAVLAQYDRDLEEHYSQFDGDDDSAARTRFLETYDGLKDRVERAERRRRSALDRTKRRRQRY